MSIYHRLWADGAAKVWNMPAHAPFLTHLAKGLHDTLGEELADALILLPTRRATRMLAQAFLALNPDGAMLLPTMRPLADMDENEPPFTTGTTDLDLPPAINPAQMRFILSRLVARKLSLEGGAPDAAAALAMSEPLAALLAEMDMEEIGPDAFDKLSEFRDLLPEHLQNAARFGEIVAKWWPQYLHEQGLISPMQRRVRLLREAARIWRESPPDRPVIVAGSTGTLAATAGLIKAVTELPRGLVVLPGLDSYIDDKVWSGVDEQHPQASLKALLKTLGLERKDIPVWPGVKTQGRGAARARILSHALIPADKAYDWPTRIALIDQSDANGKVIDRGLDGLSLIEADTPEEEAQTIALIMRETLEDKDKTCALVTPDPALARRVRARLSRWNINVDSSAGEPLEETAHGSFLALSARLAADPLDPEGLSTLMNHRLFAMDGFRHADWLGLEKTALRGLRPTGLDAIKSRLNGRYTQAFNHLAKLVECLGPLHEAFGEAMDAPHLARLHVELLERLAGGAARLWQSEAGEKSAALMEELLDYGDNLPALDGPAYQRLLSELMRGRVVRPRYGTHERLQILGPLEARMVEVDRLILGGLNEGVWPARPAPHPLLSSQMRTAMGLSLPERRFGLAAHDFESLAARSDVILSRARRDDDGPTVQSRWLWRLGTLIRGALGDETDKALAPPRPYLHWARQLDEAPDTPSPAEPPAPCPPVSARWPDATGGRKLSVTRVQTLIRDPYAIYARHVLNLEPLEALGQQPGAREFGTAWHKAVELYTKEKGSTAERLFELLCDELAAIGAFTLTDEPRLRRDADWLVRFFADRAKGGWQPVSAEPYGRLSLESLNFTLSGKADRIERKGENYAVMDYKTGGSASNAEVMAGFDPQLPLLAIMLEGGAFDMTLAGEASDKSGRVAELLYIKPRKAQAQALHEGKKSQPTQDYIAQAREQFARLIAYFDKADTPYHSQPRAKWVNKFGDYDHLARRAEWAQIRGDEI